MHELNVTREIVDLILEKSKKPKNVKVELGTLTTFKPNPIKHYFDLLKKDHPELKDTTIDIDEVPGKIRCTDCNQEFVTDPAHVYQCPKCKSFEVKVVQGKDFILKEITE